MTDPTGDGTHAAYCSLAVAILGRALRDANPQSASIDRCYRLNAWTFLQSPATVEFYRMLNVDLEWVLNLLEGEHDGRCLIPSNGNGVTNGR